MLVGVAYVVTTMGAGLTDYLTRLKLSANTNLAISGGVGLLTAMLLGVIDLAKPTPPASSRPSSSAPSSSSLWVSTSSSATASGRAGVAYPNPPGPAYPSAPYPSPVRPAPRRKRGGLGLVLVGLLLLGLLGGGGYGLSHGVTWAAGQLSKIATPPWLQVTKDPGVERLAKPASANNGTLTLTVTSVRVNQQVTMVKVTAANAGDDALTLPLLQNAQLGLPGKTLQADSSASQSLWNDTIPAKGESTGVIVFDGLLPAGSGEVTLSFSHIFGSLRGPKNISVTIPYA
jgi:hypothetical protein